MNINATLIGQTIVFAVFVWFCMKFIWPPIVASMEERKKRIENSLLAAQRGLIKQQEAEAKAIDLINQSKNQAAQIIENANTQANKTIEDAKDLAVIAANKIKAKAEIDIAQNYSKTAVALKDKLSALVMQGVNKVLAKEIDSKTHQDMIAKLTTLL